MTGKIQNTARQFIKSKHITDETLSSLPCLEDLIKNYGYKIYRYKDNDDTVAAVGAVDIANTSLAFTVSTARIKCVFIRIGISDVEARQLLLHELSHILLGHLKCDVSEKTDYALEQQEIEANLLVQEIKQRVNIQPKTTNAIKAFQVLVLICAIAVLVCGLAESVYTESPQTEDSVSYTVTVDYSTEAYVYITKSGEKYHKKNCPHIKDRRTTEMTLEEAEQLGYEPCKSCFGST